MTEATKCPKCKSENVYEDGNLWVCPECAHEWSSQAANLKSTGSSAETPEADSAPDGQIRDAFGTVLADGDAITVVKELKIKGSSSAVKVGTKVKGIRLVDGHDGHDISCKIDGLGSIYLKSEYVKKA